MSIVDKLVASVTPPESQETRMQARAKAHAAANPGDWLAMVLEHQERIEAAFAAVKTAATANSQVALQKKLAIILTGHANAEETVIYPALAASGEKGHATTAYSEQATAKIQMGVLEKLAPMTADYLDKLEHIRGAVAHHMYEEESNWFLDLKGKATPDEQRQIAFRYEEEFSRYVGTNGTGAKPALNAIIE
jgi:hypothetical protein